eukprot:SAG31_NODE_26546_length_440_cov_1.032258_1_plen_31_part_10
MAHNPPIPARIDFADRLGVSSGPSSSNVYLC